MTDIPFEVVKKYKFRGVKGYATFLLYVPFARPCDRLIFLREGEIITRFKTGMCNFAKEDILDVLPEEYVESFIPKLGRWRRRDGSEDIVVAFDLGDHYPIMGIKSIYTSAGHFYDESRRGALDLIEWLGPIPEEYLTWEEEK